MHTLQKALQWTKQGKKSAVCLPQICPIVSHTDTYEWVFFNVSINYRLHLHLVNVRMRRLHIWEFYTPAVCRNVLQTQHRCGTIQVTKEEEREKKEAVTELTVGLTSKTHILPESMTSRTVSKRVPYKLPLKSPYSRYLPFMMSASIFSLSSKK